MGQTTIIAPMRKLLKTEDDLSHYVCAYCRVSTDEQDQRNSLTAQKQFFSRYFDLHPNWHNVGIYADEGLSGTSLEKRDQFNKMIATAKQGGIDIILTKEASRFSRYSEDGLRLARELREMGVYIWFLSDDINTETDGYVDRLSIAFHTAMQESIRTGNRVKWGQQRRMELGVVFGRAEMYGYNIVKDKNGLQKFEIIEEEADTVKKIFEWFAAGDGTHTIARRLERTGIKTKHYKNGWSNTVILRILRNEKYVGDLEQGKTYTPDPMNHKKKYNKGDSPRVYIKDHHPESAVVDRVTWNKVQEILKAHEPSDEIKSKHSARYWTSGKIYCGICGGRYVSIRKKQKNIPYKAWNCFENNQRGSQKETVLETGETVTVGCDAKRVNDRVLKAALYDIITQLVKPHRDRILAEMEAAVKALRKPKDNSKKIADIERQIEETRQTLAELALQLARKVFTVEIYSLASKQEEEKLETIRKNLAKLQERDKSSEMAIQHIKNYMEQIKTVLDLSDENINEGLYERITKKIIVYPNNILEFHLSFTAHPITMKYNTQGKGKNYKVSFKIL